MSSKARLDWRCGPSRRWPSGPRRGPGPIQRRRARLHRCRHRQGRHRVVPANRAGSIAPDRVPTRRCVANVDWSAERGSTSASTAPFPDARARSGGGAAEAVGQRRQDHRLQLDRGSIQETDGGARPDDGAPTHAWKCQLRAERCGQIHLVCGVCRQRPAGRRAPRSRIERDRDEAGHRAAPSANQGRQEPPIGKVFYGEALREKRPRSPISPRLADEAVGTPGADTAATDTMNSRTMFFGVPLLQDPRR